MKKNYKPWEVKIEDYLKCSSQRERVAFLLNFAILAPSSHNSQPWSFLSDEKTIRVYSENKRRLRVGDERDKLLFISIGCAIKNILVAADFYNLQSSVDFFPDPREESLVAVINFSFNEQVELNKKDSLISYISERSVDRGKYFNKPIAPELTKIIEHLAQSLDFKINIVTGDSKNKISDWIVESSILLMNSSVFRKELSHYVKNNFTKAKVGMPAFGMGIPSLISFLVPFIIKYINLDKLSRRETENLLKKHTPAFVILSTKSDRRGDWLESGMIYQEIALNAERFGVKTSIYAAPILHETYSNLIQNELAIDFTPQVLFRVGYPCSQKKHHSPRLSANDVLKV